MNFLLLAALLVLAPAVILGSPASQFFDRIDSNGDGKINLKEYAIAAKDMLGHSAPDFIQVREALHALDLDGDLQMSKDEFFDRTGFRQARHPGLVGSSDSAPREVHLSITGNDYTEMRVIWVVMEEPGTQLVQWGNAPGNYSSQATPVSRTYNVGIGGFHGTIFDAVMTNLIDGERVYYRVGSKSGGWSEEFNFMPASHNPNAVRRFAVFGDMGTAIPIGFENSRDIGIDGKNLGFDMVLHVGDLCYAGTGGTIEVEYIWDLFGEQTEQFAAYRPYITGVGNHEHYYNWTAYLNRYHMPLPWGSPDDQGNTQFYFSFDVGNVHWCFMSTEQSYDVNSTQWNWIQQDLAQAQQRRIAGDGIDWIFVTGHRPMYSTDKDEYSAHIPGSHIQTVLEPLFLQHSVDAYFAGHQHAYERVHPVIDGKVNTLPNSAGVYMNPTAPFHVMQGTGGTFTDRSFVGPTPAWSAHHASHIGYGRLTIYNATTLSYEYVSGHGDVKPNDVFWVVKDL